MMTSGELPRSAINLGSLLGSGAFGEVFRFVLCPHKALSKNHCVALLRSVLHLCEFQPLHLAHVLALRGRGRDDVGV
jgi:hypothetical protein